MPDTPVEPDPTFAAQLRARLSRALEHRKGANVSNDAVGEQLAKTPSGTVITPYIAVAGAHAALDWYVRAFGARLRGAPIVMPDGRIGHAELDIGGARLMLSEEHPEIGVVAPVPGEGVQVTIHLDVDDVDRVITRALSAGAILARPAADYEYGRNGVIRDPFGHRWMISGQPAPTGLRHGDIAYVSLWVPEVERAAVFFEAVLGWRYEPAGAPQGRRVEGHRLHHGLWGGVEHATLFCCYAVGDVEMAGARVRAAGGAAGEPHDEPYGLVTECTDAEGTRFALLEPPGGTVSGRAPTGATVEGDVAYVTLEFGDSAGARELYGAVLGWTFAPGGSPDGWQVQDAVPMVGILGGQETATALPMYLVEDVHSAVQRVRAAGGTSTEPETQSYGVTAVCSDDQGTRFYLGQL
jgi:uncharacterized glyoxalase superfamily protein PhnB